MVDAIKSGKNREVDLFFNFALTRRRAALLYDVRMLKKNKKIHKFFTDADGQITIKTTADSKKIKICLVWNKRDFSMKTDTTAELRLVGVVADLKYPTFTFTAIYLYRIFMPIHKLAAALYGGFLLLGVVSYNERK